MHENMLMFYHNLCVSGSFWGASFWLAVPLPPPTLDNVYYNELQGMEEKQIAATEIGLVRTHVTSYFNNGYYYFYLFKVLLAISLLIGLCCSEWL